VLIPLITPIEASRAGSCCGVQGGQEDWALVQTELAAGRGRGGGDRGGLRDVWVRPYTGGRCKRDVCGEGGGSHGLRGGIQSDSGLTLSGAGIWRGARGWR
jgi:hypothetical protein